MSQEAAKATLYDLQPHLTDAYRRLIDLEAESSQIVQLTQSVPGLLLDHEILYRRQADMAVSHEYTQLKYAVLVARQVIFRERAKRGEVSMRVILGSAAFADMNAFEEQRQRRILEVAANEGICDLTWVSENLLNETFATMPLNRVGQPLAAVALFAAESRRITYAEYVYGHNPTIDHEAITDDPAAYEAYEAAATRLE